MVLLTEIDVGFELDIFDYSKSVYNVFISDANSWRYNVSSNVSESGILDFVAIDVFSFIFSKKNNLT